MMNMHLPLPLFVLAALASVGAKPVVMGSNITYSCCKKSTISFDPNAEAMFNINNMKIAYSIHEHLACMAPCKEIEPGLMTLDHCVDLTAVFSYSEGSVIIDEKMILFHGQPCSGSKRNMAAGSVVCLLLLAFGIAGL